MYSPLYRPSRIGSGRDILAHPWQYAIGALLGLVLAMQFGCGATARERVIHTTLVSVNAARDGFVAYDRKHQSDIATNAPLEVVDAKLAAYRKKREPVIEGFTAVYRAIAIAAVLNDDPKSLVALLDVARRLAVLLDQFGCDVCGKLAGKVTP